MTSTNDWNDANENLESVECPHCHLFTDFMKGFDGTSEKKVAIQTCRSCGKEFLWRWVWDVKAFQTIKASDDKKGPNDQTSNEL